MNNQIDIGASQNQSQFFTVNPAASEPNATVGQATAFNLGSFSYSGSAGNLWTVTVLWGDGTSSTFTTTSQGNLDTLNHTYKSLGNNQTFTVIVADADSNFGQVTSPMFNIVPPTSISTNTIAVITTTLDLPAVNPSLSPLTTAGNVSLRSALQYANTNSLAGTIYFQAGLTGTNNIGSVGGTYFITDPSGLAINAAGASFTVNGGGLVQDFNVAANTLVAIDNLTITGGGDVANGGGVYNAGSLTLNNDTISNNAAGSASSAYGFGGGIFNASGATLTLNDDIIDNNTADASGVNNFSSEGGGIFNYSSLFIFSTTLAGNKAVSKNGSWGSGGGIYNSGGSLTLAGDTITGNTTDAGGGGIFFFGGSGTITNTTVANNTATGYLGGGIYNSSGNVMMSDDTISGNSTGHFEGGGIYDQGGAMVISSSTIAGNSCAG